MSNEEVEDLKEMFSKIDTDNDGIVSVEELKSGLQKVNSQLADSQNQDAYRSWRISREKLPGKGGTRKVKQMEKNYGVLGNDYIEPDELRDALMEDGSDDCTTVANDIFQEAMMKTRTDWRKASRHYSRGRNQTQCMILSSPWTIALAFCVEGIEIDNEISAMIVLYSIPQSCKI
ncbi:hypothetical protein H5410_053425 [Solanum commersonii]|uniref:EF-hand domain-containing protein n=1 Tax=Solanum commersonii TaxID=4109 RepID=A0A9J5X6D0_SOLCO|nr:hypothetical protein H5410_053425 [Solanum commersonii]